MGLGSSLANGTVSVASAAEAVSVEIEGSDEDSTEILLDKMEVVEELLLVGAGATRGESRRAQRQ